MPRRGDTEDQLRIDRTRCIQLKREGKSTAYIMREIGRSRKFVKKWKNKRFNQIKSIKQSGRKRILSQRSKRIIRSHRHKRQRSPRQLKTRIQNVQNVSHQTIWRFNRNEVGRPYLRRKAPRLSAINITHRRRFGREYGDYSTDDWENVLFTDETEFTLSEPANSGRDWTWTDQPENIQPSTRPENETKLMVCIYCLLLII